MSEYSLSCLSMQHTWWGTGGVRSRDCRVLRSHHSCNGRLSLCGLAGRTRLVSCFVSVFVRWSRPAHKVTASKHCKPGMGEHSADSAPSCLTHSRRRKESKGLDASPGELGEDLSAQFISWRSTLCPCYESLSPHMNSLLCVTQLKHGVDCQCHFFIYLILGLYQCA